LNVFNPEDNGGPNLENAIGIALTVVFILPELRPTGVDKQPRISWYAFLFPSSSSSFLLLISSILYVDSQYIIFD